MPTSTFRVLVNFRCPVNKLCAPILFFVSLLAWKKFREFKSIRRGKKAAASRSPLASSDIEILTTALLLGTGGVEFRKSVESRGLSGRKWNRAVIDARDCVPQVHRPSLSLLWRPPLLLLHFLSLSYAFNAARTRTKCEHCFLSSRLLGLVMVNLVYALHLRWSAFWVSSSKFLRHFSWVGFVPPFIPQA